MDRVVKDQKWEKKNFFEHAARTKQDKLN